MENGDRGTRILQTGVIIPPQIGDINKVRELHDRYYRDEFPFPVVAELEYIRVSKKNGVITGFCALRPLFEIIMILDKSKSIRDRHLMMSGFLNESPVGELHAFIQDEFFVQTLKDHYDFRNTKGESLVRIDYGKR